MVRLLWPVSVRLVIRVSVLLWMLRPVIRLIMVSLAVTRLRPMVRIIRRPVLMILMLLLRVNVRGSLFVPTRPLVV